MHILVDSGSMHDFLDLVIAKNLGCKLESISPQSVTVADGNNLKWQFVVKWFQWKMNDVIPFSTDVLLIDLG